MEAVKKAIEKVEQDILGVERELKKPLTGLDVACFRKKEELLREDEMLLREEKKLLREKELLLLKADISERESSRKRKRWELSHMELTRSSGAASVFPVTHPATVLADKIVASVGNMPSAAFADPRTYVKLPFPDLNAKLAPQRFLLDGQRCWSYMGRKKYLEVRNAVLSLGGIAPREEDLPPVRPDKDMRPAAEGSLWGNMGSGKSYILAALVCELMSSFRKLSTTVVDGQNVQMQRVVYLPDCSELLDVDKRLVYIKSRLMLGYADDGKTLAQIDGLRDEDAIYTFLKDEHKKGVFLYFIVDQENALGLGKGDEKQKSAAQRALSCFSLYGGILKGASANNENVKKWYRKQLNIAKVFLYGGLSEEEYVQWKVHLRVPEKKAALLELSEDEEQRIQYETGCLPIFLQCWSFDISPEEAWKCFLALPEIFYAHHQLTLQMDRQLRESNPSRRYIRAMYGGFVSGGAVTHGPELYDCRYLYTRESGHGYPIGECVCGVVKRILAENLQKFDRDLFLEAEWRGAINLEGKKQHANPVILGFMVEQTIIAKALSEGIKLFRDTLVQMNRAVYFKTGSEGSLAVEEGWTLYIPSAFNYARVDAVVRGWFYEKKPGHEEERLHVAALQITLGNVQTHRKSEEQFWNPRVCDVWFENAVLENVSKHRYFVWYIRKAEFKKSEFQSFSEVEEEVKVGIVVQRGHKRTVHVVEDLVPLK